MDYCRRIRAITPGVLQSLRRKRLMISDRMCVCVCVCVKIPSRHVKYRNFEREKKRQRRLWSSNSYCSWLFQPPPEVPDRWQRRSYDCYRPLAPSTSSQHHCTLSAEILSTRGLFHSSCSINSHLSIFLIFSCVWPVLASFFDRTLLPNPGFPNPGLSAPFFIITRQTLSPYPSGPPMLLISLCTVAHLPASPTTASAHTHTHTHTYAHTADLCKLANIFIYVSLTSTLSRVLTIAPAFFSSSPSL